MPPAEAQTGHDLTGLEVLTLSEAAAYLRVSEEAVRESIEKKALPAQRIGGDWRLLKRAVTDWLRFGPRFRRKSWMLPPPWMPDHPFWEHLYHELEQRILSKIQSPETSPVQPGTKQAVLQHFGVFKDDADVANLRVANGTD